MAVHRVAHIVGDVLGDPCVEVALEDTDEVSEERDPEGQQYIKYQLAHFPGDETLVDYAPGKHRGHEGEYRGGKLGLGYIAVESPTKRNRLGAPVKMIQIDEEKAEVVRTISSCTSSPLCLA